MVTFQIHNEANVFFLTMKYSMWIHEKQGMSDLRPSLDTNLNSPNFSKTL